jgi:hypothetical protein
MIGNRPLGSPPDLVQVDNLQALHSSIMLVEIHAAAVEDGHLEAKEAECGVKRWELAQGSLLARVDLSELPELFLLLLVLQS